MKKIVMLMVINILFINQSQAQDFTPQSGHELVAVVVALKTLKSNNVSSGDLEKAKETLSTFKVKHNLSENIIQGSASLVFHQKSNDSLFFTLKLVIYVENNQSDSVVVLQPMLEDSFKNHGETLEFYFGTGVLRGNTKYHHGQKNGISKTFFSDGRLRTLMEYQNDSLIHQEYYKTIRQPTAKDVINLMFDSVKCQSIFQKKYLAIDDYFTNTENNIEYRYSQGDNDTSFFVIRYAKADSFIVMSSYLKNFDRYKRGYEYTYEIFEPYLKMKSFFINGKKVSEEEFYPSGETKRVTPFQTDARLGTVKHGVESHYRKDGTLMLQGEYQINKKTFIWIEFDKNGKHPKYYFEYEQGVLINNY